MSEKELIPNTIHLNLVIFRHEPSPSADNATTCVAWMFSWKIRTRVKLYGLSAGAKPESHDWLLLDSPRISNRIDLKTGFIIGLLYG